MHPNPSLTNCRDSFSVTLSPSMRVTNVSSRVRICSMVGSLTFAVATASLPYQGSTPYLGDDHTVLQLTPNFTVYFNMID